MHSFAATGSPARGRFGQSRLSIAMRIVAVVLLATSSPARAEPGKDQTEETDQVKKARGARLEAMRTRASSLAVHIGSVGDAERTSVEFVANPLLHYSDLAGSAESGNTADGTIWAWGKTGRPVVLAGVFFDSPRSGIEKWSCELLSLADGPVTVAGGKPGWEWKPAKSDIEWKPLPDAPAAAQTQVLRARQMKEIARRFTASQTFSPTRTDQLRLMDRPLYRYADSNRGLLDGTIYSFATGTNPEVLLLLEGRAADGENPVWNCGLARMTAAECEARLDDKVFWRRDPVVSWKPREPYYSMFGLDANVFGTIPSAPTKDN
jgi:hypothetical protein